MGPLKTVDDVQKFAEETSAQIEALNVKVNEKPETPAVTVAEVAEMKAALATFDTKIKELIIFEKAKGSWKEQQTPEAANYKGGQFIQALNENHRMPGSRAANKMLSKLGSKGVVTGTSDEPQEKEINFGSLDTKSPDTAATTSPMSGDDSAGAYYGSYTVPIEYRREISRIALSISTMISKVTNVRVPGITSDYPVTTDEMTWTKVTNQVTAKTEDNLTLARKTLTTCVYASWMAITEELREDTLADIGGLVRDMFAEAWGKKFDNLALVDTTYGAMATAGNTVTMTESSFDDIDLDYMSSMIAALTSQNKRTGAEYFMHCTVWDTLENLKSANGVYLIRQPAEGAPWRMKGYPISLSDAMTSTSAASTNFVAFGNPKFIIAGERVPFEFQVFDQTQDTMAYGLVFLRFRARYAFVLLHPEAWVSLKTSA